MKLERITDMEHEWYQKATALYQISFPVHEQREKASQEKILGWNDYHFYLILEENTFVGLLLGWETERFLYIEHFCIQPELRGRRYGQRVLEALREAGRQVILEIDPPVDDVSIRRKQFYTRCGFVENPYHHVHRRTTGEIRAMNWWCCPLRRRFPEKSTRGSGTIWSAG